MGHLHAALLRKVWAWLGYRNGLPVTVEDMSRTLTLYQQEVVRSVTTALTHLNATNRRVELAAHILGSMREPDTARALALADELLRRG